MSALTLSGHYRRVLQSVADGSCFVAMSGTLCNLGDLGLLAFDACRSMPWAVTADGYETLAIGDVAEEA